MANRKKLVTSAIALGTAAALTLGGTFAWQSISQEALNESSDVVNPGGRLHNDLYYTDLNTTDSNVYVENFTEEGSGEDIFARVRLEEYMEVVLNHGTPAEQTMTLIGSREDTTETDDDGNETIVSTKYNYKLFDFNKHVNEDGTVTAGLVTSGEGDDAVTESRFTWTMGGKDTDDYYFMPTFNKNKDSLAADLNGLYVDRVGGISKREEKQYEKHTAWAENATHEGFEIYDTDSNMIDELEDLDAADLNAIIDGTSSLGRGYEGSVKLTRAKVTHTAKAVAKSNGLISMDAWLALNEAGDDTENYWVYDTDGWVYWSAPIKAGEATGLLLDSFTLSKIMDNSWYYAINVVGQFITADDLGQEDGTGFYDTSVGEAPSRKALILLDAIGVEMENKVHSATLEKGHIALLSIASRDSVIFTDSEGERIAFESLYAVGVLGKTNSSSIDLERDEDYTYEDGVFTLKSTDKVPAGAGVVITLNGSGGMILMVDTDSTLTLTGNKNETIDFVEATVGQQIPVRFGDTGEAPNTTVISEAKNVDIWENAGMTAADYVYEDGYLTFINPIHTNCIVLVEVGEEYGMIYLKADGDITASTEPLTLYSVSGTTMAPAGALEDDGYYSWKPETTYVVSNIPHDEDETLSWNLYEHSTTDAANTEKIGFVTDDGLSAIDLDDDDDRGGRTTTTAARPTLTIRATDAVTKTDYYSLVGTNDSGTEKYRFTVYFGDHDPTVVTALSNEWKWDASGSTLTIDEDGASTYITGEQYDNIKTLLALSATGLNDYNDDMGAATYTCSNFSVSGGSDWYGERSETASYAVKNKKGGVLFQVDNSGALMLNEAAMDHADYGQLSDVAISMDVTMTCGDVTETRTLTLTVQSFLNSMKDRNDVVKMKSNGGGEQNVPTNGTCYLVADGDYTNAWLSTYADDLTTSNCQALVYTNRNNQNENTIKATTLTNKDGDSYKLMEAYAYGGITVDTKHGYIKFEGSGAYGYTINFVNADLRSPTVWFG